MKVDPQFEVDADPAAHAWLEAHRSEEALVISYDVHRCCGGGKICTVQVRGRREHEALGSHSTAVLQDGTRLAIEPRASARLPARFSLTTRGIGPFRHLDLDLEGEEWGALLYD